MTHAEIRNTIARTSRIHAKRFIAVPAGQVRELLTDNDALRTTLESILDVKTSLKGVPVEEQLEFIISKVRLALDLESKE